MLLLLSEPAFVHFGDRLAAAVPGMQFLRMQADGDLLLEDRAVTWENAAPDVAWLTADLFAGGPVRKFLKLTLLTTPAWLQSSGAGTDHPVFQMLLDGGTRLTASHVTGVPIAEYVVRAVLEHYQQPAVWAGARRDGEWAPHDFREVFGTTWLIVGMGHIGSEVATRAKAFGATVVGIRRAPDGSEPVDECMSPERMQEAVARADVVVLAAPGGPETRHLFGADLLSAMPPRSVLVNVGRGSLVDERALRRALDTGIPEIAILDVTEEEPPSASDWLWTHPSVVLTPHTSAGGSGRYGRAATAFIDNLVRWDNGEALAHEVTAAET